MKSRGLIVLFVAVFALSSFWICEAQSSASGAEKAKDIVDTAVSAGQFKTLAAALKAAGLVETLKGKGPFTVFAPTDEAFAKLPKGTVEGLLKPENKDQLIAILTYHVVPGKVMAKDVVKLKKAKSVQGAEIQIRAKKKRVMVDKAVVTATDIRCSNGVIHVIDSVILPRDIVDTAVAAGQFKTLAAALKAAGLVEDTEGERALHGICSDRRGLWKASRRHRERTAETRKQRQVDRDFDLPCCCRQGNGEGCRQAVECEDGSGFRSEYQGLGRKGDGGQGDRDCARHRMWQWCGACD